MNSSFNLLAQITGNILGQLFQKYIMNYMKQIIYLLLQTKFIPL